MEIPLLQIDAFASQAFKGNPAAVCLLESAKPADWMQNVGAEMNLAETAFVVPRPSLGNEVGQYDLRWFTPAIEIPLCGHATLASAHALWQTGRLAESQEAHFHTMSGELICRRIGKQIEMDFPALIAEPAKLPDAAVEAMGIKPVNVVCHRRKDGSDGNFLIELDSETAVRNVKPNFYALSKAANAGFIITARGDSSYDFVSRYFACYAGIDEDPVTGSAHCMLTPYWAKALGKMEMMAYQASARGGEVRVRLAGDRVFLAGEAITVLSGNLLC